MSDREEGEIVDDDFEDISDNSIIVPLYTGKFESPRENLPAIYLSSVSDSDTAKRISRLKPTKKKSKCYRKRRCRHEKSIVYNSDSDDCELDHKLHKQLKAAVQVESDVCHKNSLRSRLRVMNNLNKNFSDEDIEKSDKDSLEQKPSTDDVDDELIQLRLEALRTAVFNKYEHRKKRKRDILQQNECQKSPTNSCDTNKENTHSENEIKTNKKPCFENSMDEAIKIINNTPPDEDEDVLRALLLASMSKKITKVIDSTKSASQIEKNNFVKHNRDKTRTNVWPVSVETQIMKPFKNRIAHKNTFKTHPLQLTDVKPIIINVDDDSDSDDDFSHKLVENTKDDTHEIESTVERFLKEQRARIEAKTELSVLKITSSNETKQTISKKNIETSDILEKSSVKLLPKVKQLEYQKLLEKLKHAEKNNKCRTSAKVISAQKSCNISKKITGTKLPIPKKTTITNSEKFPDIKSDARALHIALKEMQTQKNGRLQIEEKYVVLTPIIKKINEATTERKKYDQEIKRLLEELKAAKKKLHTTHLNFSTYVKELIAKKKEIEMDSQQACTKKVIVANQPEHLPTFTSTPKKDLQFQDSLEISSVAATPNILIAEKSQVKKTEEIADDQIKSNDPNNILKVSSVIPKYISPLDYIKRKDLFDPLAITCPYDIDGNCRDPECSYKHYSKRKE